MTVSNLQDPSQGRSSRVHPADARCSESVPPVPESVRYLGDTPTLPESAPPSAQVPSEPKWREPPPPRRISRMAIWCLVLALVPLVPGFILVATDAIYPV